MSWNRTKSGLGGSKNPVPLFSFLSAWPKPWNVLNVLRHWITTEFSPKILPKCKGAQKMSYDCRTCDNIDHCDDCNQWSMAVNSWAHCHCQVSRLNLNLILWSSLLKEIPRCFLTFLIASSLIGKPLIFVVCFIVII